MSFEEKLPQERTENEYAVFSKEDIESVDPKRIRKLVRYCRVDNAKLEIKDEELKSFFCPKCGKVYSEYDQQRAGKRPNIIVTPGPPVDAEDRVMLGQEAQLVMLDQTDLKSSPNKPKIKDWMNADGLESGTTKVEYSERKVE